ncbi:MAG: putative LPS assembly protein LptD [Bacteroidales bacterium]
MRREFRFLIISLAFIGITLELWALRSSHSSLLSLAKESIDLNISDSIKGVLYDSVATKRNTLHSKRVVDSAGRRVPILQLDSAGRRVPTLQLDSAGRASVDSAEIESIKAADPALADSLGRAGVADTTKKGSLLYPIFSEARDSVVEDFSNGKRVINYYGDVSVKYGSLSIKSAFLSYDLSSSTVYATGLKDSSNLLQGKPVVSEGNDQYEMEEVHYNFKSRKAIFKNMITQENEGFLHGAKLKKMADNSINIAGGKYTTCDSEHPHFYLKYTNAKVVTQPNRVTIFGPAYLVVEDVPTPFALPFGFIPERATRASGLLIPTFNDEASRGFSLKGLGYYFVFGDHFDVTLTGDIYTLGSWNAMLTSRYKKRYKYNGNLSLNYSVNQVGEKGAPDFRRSKDFAVRWSHTQDPKSRPGTSFRASVNFSTPMNDRLNSYDIQQSLQNQISSSVSYGKTFYDKPFSLSLNLLHSQNSLDSSYALTIPNLTFTLNRIFPFKRKEGVGKERFLEKISLSYNSNFNNKLNFRMRDLNEEDLLSKFRSGMQHNFQIGLPPFTLLNYFQFSPGLSFGMNWFFQESSKHYNSDNNRVESEVGSLFSHFGATTDYSASLSMATTIYGLFNFGKKRNIRAIRHMIKPSMSLSYRPEQGTAANGYLTYNYIDRDGNLNSLEYNRYEGLGFGYPSKGSSASLNFSVSNNVEAKVVDKKDRDELKKIKIIDNLSLRGSYNFIADSLKLSNISTSLTTTIFGSLALNANATFNPYAVDNNGRTYNKYQIEVPGGGIARLTNASLSFSYQFSGEGRRKGAGKGFPANSFQKEFEYTRIYNHPVTGEYIPGGWVFYMDPNNPWSVNFNYNYSYGRSYSNVGGELQSKHNFMQTLGVSAQLKLGRDLNININTGIDLMKMALTTTQLSATYDLHCFLISFSWVPSGMFESWSFRINAKSSALADLLQFKKNASYWDRRGGL